MIVSYKLCINILLEPVKVDIKRTQTKSKTVRKYSNNTNQPGSQVETGAIFLFGIIFLFMNVKRFKRSFSVVSSYIRLYIKKV